MDNIKPIAESLNGTNGVKRENKTDKPIHIDHPNQNAKPAENTIKQRIAGIAPTQPTTRVPNDTTLHPQTLTKQPASLQTKRQNTQNAATAIRGQGRCECIFNRRPHDAIQSRLKSNLQRASNTRLAKKTGNSSNQKVHFQTLSPKKPPWITEAEDKYMTTKRLLPPTSEHNDDHQTNKNTTKTSTIEYSKHKYSTSI